MRFYFLAIFSISFSFIIAQPPQVPHYTINNIPLVAEMDNQVSISGLKFFNNNLYMVSERCASIFIVDPAKGNIISTIPLKVPKEFEMEGITSYKDKLYLVSENVAAIYEVDPKTNELKIVTTSIPLPPKSKHGDGMEGIAANEKNNKFYLLRERTEDRSKSQVFTFSVEQNETGVLSLKHESTIDLPLENNQWRYADICVDTENSRLFVLKSYSKGKTRQQFLESIVIDNNGGLVSSTLSNVPVEKFSEISGKYKDENFSMNLEGLTIDNRGNMYVVSDNTSGKTKCDTKAKEKTILLQLKRK